MHGKCQCQTDYGFGILIGKRKERGESRILTGRREKTEKKLFCPDFIDIYRGGHSFLCAANVCGYKMVVCFDVCVHYL